jgi:hypothetical protein
MTAVAVRVDDRFSSAAGMLRFIDGMKTKTSNRDALIAHLRYLYPTADFNAPPIPDYSGQAEEVEKSMVFALSEEAAKSVFGRGELPVEWTTQFKVEDMSALRDLRDRDAREARERDKQKRAKAEAAAKAEALSEATVDGSDKPDESATGEMPSAKDRGKDALATPLRAKGPDGPLDDTPTTIAHADSGMPVSAMVDDKEPTRFERSPGRPGIRDTSTDSRGTDHAARVIGERAGFSENERFHDEATVMMVAPPRLGRDQGEEEPDAKTRTVPQPPPSASTTPFVVNSPPSSAIPSTPPLAIQRPSRPSPDRERPPNSANPNPNPNQITRGRVPQRERPPEAGRGRGERPAPAAPQSLPQSKSSESSQVDARRSNLMLLGLVFMGITIVILLVVLIYLT